MICKHCTAAAAENPGKPHEPCKEGCPCQHGRPWEQDPNPEGFQGYLDALPDGHPERVRYETQTGRRLPPRAGAGEPKVVDLSGMQGHCCFAGCTLTTCNRCGASYCVNGGLHVCQPEKPAPLLSGESG